MHAICSFGDLASFIAKYSFYSTGHDSLLLLFILLLKFPPFGCWELFQVGSCDLWTCPHHFLSTSFLSGTINLSWLILYFPFLSPEIPAQFSKEQRIPGKSTPVGQTACPQRRRSWGGSHSSPAGPKKEERWRASLTRRHWGGRTEGLHANVGSLCNSGWWRAHANTDIMHLRLLWVLATSPNSIVHESLPRIFMTLSLGCPLYPRMPSHCFCTTVLPLPAISSHVGVFVVMDWTGQWPSYHITADEEPLDICLKTLFNMF